MAACREGEIEILKTGRWWDSETHYRAALDWYARHSKAVHEIPANRWEAFQRAGEAQIDYAAFRKAVECHMWKVEKDKDGRDEKRYQRGFTAVFSSELLAAIEEATKPDRSKLTVLFEASRETLSMPDRAAVLDRFKLRQAREFIGALTLQIRLAAAGAKEQKK